MRNHEKHVKTAPEPAPALAVELSSLRKAMGHASVSVLSRRGREALSVLVQSLSDRVGAALSEARRFQAHRARRWARPRSRAWPNASGSLLRARGSRRRRALRRYPAAASGAPPQSPNALASQAPARASPVPHDHGAGRGRTPRRGLLRHQPLYNRAGVHRRKAVRALPSMSRRCAGGRGARDGARLVETAGARAVRSCHFETDLFVAPKTSRARRRFGFRSRSTRRDAPPALRGGTATLYLTLDSDKELATLRVLSRDDAEGYLCARARPSASEALRGRALVRAAARVLRRPKKPRRAAGGSFAIGSGRLALLHEFLRGQRVRLPCVSSRSSILRPATSPCGSRAWRRTPLARAPYAALERVPRLTCLSMIGFGLSTLPSSRSMVLPTD